MLCLNVSAADGGAAATSRTTLIVALGIMVVALFIIVICLFIRNKCLEKTIRPLLMIPIQMGIINAKGTIFFYQNGKYDKSCNCPGSLRDLPIEMQQEFQKALPAIFEKRDTRSIEFDVFKFRRKIDFFYLDENPWCAEPVVMWISHDISNLHQACLERERVAERFRQTLSSIGDAVVVTNYDAEIIMMNSVAAKMSMVAPEQSAGKKINECFGFVELDLVRLVENVIRTGSEYPLNSSLRRQDGREIVIEGKISPVKEKEVLVAGTVLCFRDITERIKMHKQEQKALKLAQEADRAKSDFIAAMNHEFRSSLNTIIGYCELSQMNDGNAINADLSKIQSESHKLLNGMNNLLDFSRANFNSMEIEVAPSNFKSLLYEIQRIFLKTADEKKIPLQISSTANLPLFMSDYKVMRQVLIGFLTQAYSIADRGEVTLAISWLPPCLKIEIAIRMGQEAVIPEAELDFPINRQLLQLLNGFYEFHKDNDREVLSIVFPEMESCGEAEQTNIAVPQLLEKPKKDIVIIVDDIAVNQKLLVLMLKKLNIESVAFGSVKEALEALDQYLPMAILTDLWMPECNGDEFATMLKDSPQTSAIPIVLITADNQLDQRTRGLFNYTIIKPLKSDTLKAVMNQITHCA